MKISRLLFLGIVLAGMLAYLSCRKLDTSPQNQQLLAKADENKFFYSHRTADPTEKAIVEFVKR